MIEKEIWSEIDKKTFDVKLEEFKDKFGEPKVKKRLAFRIGCNDRIVINTRIKIENGRAYLLQKVSEDLNTTERSEYELEIPSNPKDILEVFNIFKYLLNHLDTYMMRALQFENYFFQTDDYEIKLTHQFGKSDVYSFEIEVKDNDLDPIEIVKELGLKPDLSPRQMNSGKSLVIKLTLI